MGRFAILVNPLETLYDYERWAIRILLVVMILFGIGMAGHALDIENPLSEAVYTYFLDSILNESGGDSGFSISRACPAMPIPNSIITTSRIRIAHRS